MRLKIGVSYVARDGTITEPMRYSGNGAYPFFAVIKMSMDITETWAADGTYHLGRESPLDLVAEHIPKSPPKDIDQMTPADYRRGVDAIWPSMRGL